MDIEIAYGDEKIKTTLPGNFTSLTTSEPQQKMSEEYFLSLLNNELTKNPLDLTDTIIIVADKTRVCGYSSYLPSLVKLLKEFGMIEKNLRFIIAYGTHQRQSDAECLENYGDTYHQHPFIHHDCTRQDIFVDCGMTSRGTPIRVRKDIYTATSVITMGPICHHYFAGYGGGRKLIFPGCGEREAIYKNHSLFLDQKNMRLSPNCQPGILKDNPLATDLFEIAEQKEANLAIHGIMNSHGELCDIVIGKGRKSYLEACVQHAELCESKALPSPLVLASCGGFPKDINFIQSHKAIHNASMFVEDGGTLIIFSQCRDNIGSSTFLPWYEMESFAEAFNHLCTHYEGNGGTALAMMTKTQRIRIIMVTELEEEICQRINVERWNKKQALDFVKDSTLPATYIANASLLVSGISTLSQRVNSAPQ